jgi:hypothetical protein
MFSGVTVSRRRVAMAAALMLSVLSLAAGCGKASYEYVVNKDEQTYFRVPSGWTKVDPGPIEEAFFGDPDSLQANVRKAGSWTVVYDSSTAPTGYHMFTQYPTALPIVFAMVRHVPEAERGAISLDSLRNELFPVTAELRDAYVKQGQDLPPGFELLYDQVLTPSGGVRGVRVVYDYAMGGSIGWILHTFDVTALVNNDSSIVYLLVMRCTARCYLERATELDGIATSFTVGNKA